MVSIEEFKAIEAEFKAIEAEFKAAKEKAAATEIELLVLYGMSFRHGYPELVQKGHGHTLEEIDALVSYKPTDTSWLYVVKKQWMRADGTLMECSELTGFFKDHWQDGVWHTFDYMSTYDECFSLQSTEKTPEGWKEWQDHKHIEPYYTVLWSDTPGEFA